MYPRRNEMVTEWCIVIVRVERSHEGRMLAKKIFAQVSSRHRAVEGLRLATETALWAVPLQAAFFAGGCIPANARTMSSPVEYCKKMKLPSQKRDFCAESTLSENYLMRKGKICCTIHDWVPLDYSSIAMLRRAPNIEPGVLTR